MKGASLFTVLAAALVVLLGSGCRTWVAQAEISELPIAIAYRTPEESRRNAEALLDQRDQIRGGGGGGGTPGEATAHVDQVGSYFANLFGVAGGAGDNFLPRLALLDPRSGNVVPIDAALRGSVPLAWSPDHERLLFAQPSRRGFQIYEFHRVLGTVRPVTRGPYDHSQGCYGSEGRIVVTAVDVQAEPPRSWIAISKPGGRGPYTPLSDGDSDYSVSCSPDGSAIAFVRRDPKRGEQIVARYPVVTDGEWPEHEQVIGPGRHPEFSPDGEWLVFSSPYRREWRIYRARLDGTGRSRLGNGIRTEIHPSFSPDGRLVIFVASEEVPKSHLYVRRFDGTGDRILFRSGDAEFPVW